MQNTKLTCQLITLTNFELFPTSLLNLGPYKGEILTTLYIVHLSNEIGNGNVQNINWYVFQTMLKWDCCSPHRKTMPWIINGNHKNSVSVDNPYLRLIVNKSKSRKFTYFQTKYKIRKYLQEMQKKNPTTTKHNINLFSYTTGLHVMEVQVTLPVIFAEFTNTKTAWHSKKIIFTINWINLTLVNKHNPTLHFNVVSS